MSAIVSVQRLGKERFSTAVDEIHWPATLRKVVDRQVADFDYIEGAKRRCERRSGEPEADRPPRDIVLDVCGADVDPVAALEMFRQDRLGILLQGWQPRRYDLGDRQRPD
jgi:hypothetical protein